MIEGSVSEADSTDSMALARAFLCVLRLSLLFEEFVQRIPGVKWVAQAVS